MPYKDSEQAKIYARAWYMRRSKRLRAKKDADCGKL